MKILLRVNAMFVLLSLNLAFLNALHYFFLKDNKLNSFIRKTHYKQCMNAYKLQKRGEKNSMLLLSVVDCPGKYRGCSLRPQDSKTGCSDT